MTAREKAGMRLIAIKDAITAAEECIRILRSEEQTARRDIRESERVERLPSKRQHPSTTTSTAASG